MNNFLLDPALSPIADKVMADERLSFEDGWRFTAATTFTAWDVWPTSSGGANMG